MAITMTDDFRDEHIKRGTSPVMLVEIQTAGEFFATREPGFTGNWKAGDGLIAGSGIQAGDAYPTYDTFLQQLIQGGIGTITQTWEPQSGLALTGSTNVQIINQGLYSHITDDIDLTNARIRIRLGFFGQTFADYITVFQGAIEEFDATLLDFNLRCVDDTLVTLKPAPPQTGSDFLPRASTVGRTIPVVLGDVDLVPAFPILTDVSGSLFLAVGTLDTEIFVTPVTAAFPPTGEITVNAEVITYTSVTESVVGQQQVLVFSGLTRPAPATHDAGDDVDLTSVVYEYLLGMEAASLRRIRLEDGSDPTTAVTVVSRALDPEGNDPRRITVLLSDTADEALTATVEGENRAPNLIVNGEGDADPATLGWTLTSGAWASVVLGSENVIRGRVVASQAIDSELVQDVTTTDGALMRFTGTITLDGAATPPFATIRIGTPGSPSSVFDFGQITSTSDQGVDLTFRAPSGGTTRITLVVNSDTPGSAEDAYFDHLHLYEVDSENPSTQVQFLINKHMRNINVDPVSFGEAFTLYQELGDRMAGTLDTTQEAQNLLGRLAFQFRAKTFFNESGKQKWIVFDNARPPVLTISANDVDKGSFHVSLEPEEKIRTHFYVYFNRRADVTDGTLGGRDSYQNVLFATPEDTNSVEDAVLSVLCQQARDLFRVDRVMEIFADMIPDASTADRLLSQLVREYTYRRYIATFTTWINNVELEVGDIVRIGHDLLPDSANGVTFEVQEKQFFANGMKVAYKCAEIRQSQYSAWVERWEPPFNGTPSLIHQEDWNEPPIPFVSFIDENGDPIRLNPWIENWEPSVTARGERFQYNDATDFLGNDPVDITESLIWSHEPEFVNYADPDDDPGVEDLTPDSFHLPVTTERGAPTNIIPTPSGGRIVSASPTLGGNYQLTVQEGVAIPGSGARRPTLLPTGGPGSNSALQFIRNGTAPSKFVVRQTVNTSFGGDWTLHDFTLNFWLYQTEKGSNVRPFCVFNNRPINLADIFEHTDQFPWFMWWDNANDRYEAVVDYELTDGVDINPLITDLITDFKGHANYLPHTGLGTPSLNTWYMHTIRWDLSALGWEWRINDSTSVTATLAGAPTTPVTYDGRSPFPLLWMGMERNIAPFNFLSTSYGMNGRWAQPSVWARRLTDAEVTSLYNSGSSLPYPFT